MNCDECKNVISRFMDNDLEEAQASVVREHLSLCTGCAVVCEDFAAILDVCTEAPSELLPPDSRNLWLRINNIIENEIKAEQPPPAAVPQRRSWQLSFGQLAAVLACIAIVSSLITVVAFRSYMQVPAGDYTSRSAATQTTFEKVLAKVGLMETPQQARDRRLREQRATIEYWNARVQSRRPQWDRATREAFDRNLQVIDESVGEYTQILQRDPEDELSGEMLDTVMNDKMTLLRDFAEL